MQSYKKIMNLVRVKKVKIKQIERRQAKIHLNLIWKKNKIVYYI